MHEPQIICDLNDLGLNSSQLSAKKLSKVQFDKRTSTKLNKIKLLFVFLFRIDSQI